MKKDKTLTENQKENLKMAIKEAERLPKLHELYMEVEDFFHRHPTADCRDIVPKAMASLLFRFSYLMEGYGPPYTPYVECNKRITRLSDHERAIQKGDTLDYDLEDDFDVKRGR